MLKSSPVILILVLMAGAIAWAVIDRPSEDDPHAVRPLAEPYERRHHEEMQRAQPQMPQLPEYDPELDDPSFRSERIERTELGGNGDEVGDELRGEHVDESGDEIGDEVREGAADEGEADARRRTIYVRRVQSLDFVDRLLGELNPTLEDAVAAGDDPDQVEWLQATQRRLNERRSAIEASIAEMGVVPPARPQR